MKVGKLAVLALLLLIPILATEVAADIGVPQSEVQGERAVVDEQDEFGETDEEALLADATAMAAQLEEINSPADAMNLLAHQVEMDAVSIRVRSALGEGAFAGMYHEIGSPETVLMMTDANGPDVENLLGKIDGLSVVDGFELSREEFVEAAGQLGQDLHKSGRFGGTAVLPSLRDHSLTITVAPTERGQAAVARDSDRLIGEAEAILHESLAEGEASITTSVSVARLEGFEGLEEFGYGGDSIRTAGGVVTCTTGFTATKFGVGGILTAGHCGLPGGQGSTADHYAHANNVQHTIQVPANQIHVGAFGDFRWFKTPATEKPKFYARAGQFRSVTGFRHLTLMDPGDLVCNFGRKSNNFEPRCGYIDSTSYTQGSTGSLVLMDRAVETAHGLKTIVGDSGGPWSTGNTAYGLHTGRAGAGNPGCEDCDVFTPVSTALGYLNLVLMTT